MKLSTFSTIVLLHLATSSSFFIPPIQCTLPKPSLVEQICRKTPHYHLCVLTLKSCLSSNHRRSSADIAGFARMALEVVTANASATLEHVHKVYVQTSDTQLKIALDGCITSYAKIVKVHLPEALNAMDKGDYKGAKHGAYAAGNQADSCENKLKDTAGSPLRDTNRYVHNLCAITVSIVNKLLQKPNHQTLA